jgi:hypothetical protein
MSLHQSCEHRRSLQYVDVIVGSRHPEERMSNSQVIIGDSFKDHTAFSIYCGLCTTLTKQTRNSFKPNACNRCYQAF